MARKTDIEVAEGHLSRSFNGSADDRIWHAALAAAMFARAAAAPKPKNDWHGKWPDYDYLDNDNPAIS